MQIAMANPAEEQLEDPVSNGPNAEGDTFTQEPKIR